MVSDPANQRTVIAVKKDDSRFPLIGKTVGDILLESGIAEGGMGVVYKGKKDGRDVAVKVLRDEYTGDKNSRDRFLGDVEISKQLNHPNVLEVLSFSDNGVPYFVTPFMPFNLEKTNLTAQESANVLLKIARVLMHAHNNKIIHRDVKPSNVLLDESLEVKVCDWGIAKNVNLGAGRTLHREIMGSPEYIAPEQCDDSKTVEAAADIYSWAATGFFVHSDTAPREDRTTTMKRSNTSKHDTNTALVSRANVNKPYKIWLNDAIELRRAELSDSGKERVVRLSEEYEDSIMMLLNAKDPKYRPPLDSIIRNLELLITTDSIVYKEPSAQETAHKLQVYSTMLKDVEQAKADVESLRPLQEVGWREWLRPKLKLAQSLESLANQTARDDEKRGVYFNQAFELYSEIDVSKRTSSERVEGLDTLDEKLAWLRCVTNHEQARKVYLGAKKAEKETREAVDSASYALADMDFEEAARHYKRIDFSVLDLKESVDSLTQVMAKLAEENVEDGEKLSSDKLSVAPAILKYDAAFKLSEVLPESFADLKKRVGSLYVKINATEIKGFEAAYAAARSDGDYVRMFQSAHDIEGRLKKIGKDAPEDAVKSSEAHKAELKDKEMDISILLKIRESISGSIDRTISGLENEFNKEIETAKSRAVYPLTPEKLAPYEAGVEDKLAKMGLVNKDNVGPQYDRLFSHISSLKEKIVLEKDMYLVSQGTFYERAEKAAQFAARYAGKNPGMETIFKNLLFRFVTDEIAKAETKKL